MSITIECPHCGQPIEVLQGRENALPALILDFLQKSDHSVSLQEICDHFPKKSYKMVRNALYNMKKSKTVLNPERGYWCA